MKKLKITEKLDENLDLVLGIAVAFGGAIIATTGYIVETAEMSEMGIVILAASVFYLVFRERITGAATPSFPFKLSLTLVLNIIFVAALAASLYLMHASLHRPPVYFILVSICVAVVAVEILSSEENQHTGWLLLKILLIALVIRAGLFYEVPGFLGADAWYHEAAISQWLSQGHITGAVPTLKAPEGYISYVDFPVLHLLVMSASLITDVTPKDSLFLSIGIYNTVSILFVFLIGERLLSKAGGLMAALFASIIVPHIVSGVVLIPNSLGVVIFTIILFLVIRKRTYPMDNILLFIIFATVMVFSHTLSSFVTLIALVLMLTIKYLYGRLTKKPQEKINITAMLLILFIVVMFAQWTNANVRPGLTYFDALSRALLNSLQEKSQFTGEILQVASASSLNRGWYHMFIGLTVIGTLSWVSARLRNNLRMTFVASTVLLAVIVVILPVLNIKVFITPRWVPFIIVTGAALVAQAIMTLPGIMKWRTASLVLTVTVVFALSMFSINSTNISSQSILTKEISRRDFIQSELTAADTTSDKYDGVIFSDWEYIEFIYNTRYDVERLEYLGPEIQERGTYLVVVREFARRYPEFTPYGWRNTVERPSLEELNEFYAKFSRSDYNLIYTNGEVQAYASTNQPETRFSDNN